LPETQFPVHPWHKLWSHEFRQNTIKENHSESTQRVGLLASSIANAPNIPVWVLAVGAIFFAVVFTAVSIAIQGVFSTSAYDLGLFEQAFWRYSQLLPNFNTVRGMNILARLAQPMPPLPSMPFRRTSRNRP
jgi:hypothetical protein